MKKIQMLTPLVEMDGDEMTRILWKWIKEELICPFVDLKTDYYDLGLKSRDLSDDEITVLAAKANLKYGVAVKCATITPNADRMTEYDLKKMWKSPNGTIRAILDGIVFRAPIIVKGINPLVPTWKKPIVIARHAYGDIYKASDCLMKDGKAALCVDGDTHVICEGVGNGVVMGMYNTDASIRNFAISCFEYAYSAKLPLMFSAKDTISKVYDRRFRDIFDEVYKDYKVKFEEAGITYFYTLIDDAVARIIRGDGGIVWALKNYDGDVMSDMVATAFGSLAMMTSILVSPTGAFEYEAAHGTVTRHYYRYLKGEETSTNPVATIFAWTGALKKRGEKDGTLELVDFADKLEHATIETIESGYMTGDLAQLFISEVKKLNSLEFLQKIRENLEKSL